MTLTLLDAGEADLDLLLGSMARFNDLEGIAWSVERCRPPLLQLLRDRSLGVVVLLVEGSARVGYAVLTWGFDLEWAGREAWLTELFLEPEVRGRGVGRAALRLLEARAVAEGARAMHLMVREENDVARRLYRSAGFELPGRVMLTRPLAAR
jgi:ribosomal protein S18 acetylase RimI-like enzyme